jgi:DNA-binding NarL/FixJ family response regulator
VPALAEKEGQLTINVAVIDDLDIIRVGIQQFLSGMLQCHFVGGYATTTDFCSAPTACYSTDVIVLDDTLPDADVFQSVTRIQRVCARPAIIVLGNDLTAQTIQRLLRHGVQGFICKNEPLRDTLLVGIRRVYDGKAHFSPEAALISTQFDPPVTLSPRLTQVLELIAQGLHVQGIARELSISPRAVYAARSRLRDALGVQTDAQLGAEAMRRGLLRYE